MIKLLFNRFIIFEKQVYTNINILTRNDNTLIIYLKTL